MEQYCICLLQKPSHIAGICPFLTGSEANVINTKSKFPSRCKKSTKRLILLISN